MRRLTGWTLAAALTALPAFAAPLGGPSSCTDLSAVAPFTQFRFDTFQSIFDALQNPKDPNSGLCTSCHPGSIGAGGHQHVHPGQRMAGRMGGDRVTVKNLEIVEVLAEQGLIAVKGAVPGPRGATLLIVAPQGDMKFISAKKPAEEAPVAQEAAPATETATVTE